MTGTIKTKTPKFKLIIPLFNIATWHDYIEENFRTIDALFYNLFDIQNFKGAWKNITEYSIGDVVFIPEDYEIDENGQLKTDEQGELIESQYSGRMVKVLVNHTTDNSDYFSQYLYQHLDYYEFFVDASTSQMFAQNAKDAANESKHYAEEATNQVQLCKNEVTNAKQEVTNAKEQVSLAEDQVNLAQQYANNAKVSENSAAVSRENAKVSEKVALKMADLTQQYTNDAKLWAVGTITEKPEGSSKYWAEQAQQTAQVYNASETVKGIVRLATSEEVKAGTNDSAVITPLKFKQKIVQDLSTPSTDTVPSTQAVSNNYVKKSGDTMTGGLTVKDANIVLNSTKDVVNAIVKTYEDNTETPTETHIDAFRVYDKNNMIMSDFRSQRTSTDQTTQMLARKNNSDGTLVQSSISCSIDFAGNPSSTLNQNTYVNGAMVSNLDNVNFIARSKSLVKGTTPTDSNKYIGYDWQDKNGQRLAYMGVKYGTDGSKILELQKLDSNLQKFVVNYLTTFVAQPQTSISGNARYKSVCTGYTKGTAPTAVQFGGVSTTDKNGTEVATIYSSIDTSNNVMSALFVKQPTASGTATSSISIWCDNNGAFHSYCGVQSNANNSILTIVSHGDNWIKYSDGRLEQWGTCTAAQQTITLYQPYKDTNYAVNVTLGANENNNYCPVVVDFTTTSFNKADRGQYWHAIGWWK